MKLLAPVGGSPASLRAVKLAIELAAGRQRGSGRFTVRSRTARGLLELAPKQPPARRNASALDKSVEVAQRQVAQFVEQDRIGRSDKRCCVLIGRWDDRKPPDQARPKT